MKKKLKKTSISMEHRLERIERMLIEAKFTRKD